MVKGMNIKDFTPIDDRVVVKPHETEEKTEGGIFLPSAVVEQKREIVQSGEIVAVGPGRLTPDGKHEKMLPGLKVGTTTFFARFQGWLFTIEEDGEEIEFRIFGQHDLFGYKETEEDE